MISLFLSPPTSVSQSSSRFLYETKGDRSGDVTSAGRSIGINQLEYASKDRPPSCRSNWDQMNDSRHYVNIGTEGRIPIDITGLGTTPPAEGTPVIGLEALKPPHLIISSREARTRLRIWWLLIHALVMTSGGG
ncbi:hypothetical protein AVEN_130006-1 [Araneus ventricosus]|uniref:Uncharacterized protein n=1 Tax=Araneus ventricosus TaxID=182803 RepID=A0A4Y2JMV8_ARAVE|nr:hypothetical protein AVEN_130006-1 [Araneus ventricosus]